MTKARIYCPDKNAMQSGMAKTSRWKLEFAPQKPYFVDDLMGWVGMTDMPREIHLFFPSEEAAVAYAKRQNIPFEVTRPHKRALVKKAYADNFKFSRIQG
jgi:hypothetical protein